MKSLGARVHARSGSWHLAWLFIPLVLTVIALARPQLTRTYEEIKESGIEMIVAIDISSSMDAEDFTIGGRRASRLLPGLTIRTRCRPAWTRSRITGVDPTCLPSR